MEYRIGKKQKRVILDSSGHEVLIINDKYKHLVNDICDSLNSNFLNGDTEKRGATICPNCNSGSRLKIWQNPVKFICEDCGTIWDK